MVAGWDKKAAKFRGSGFGFRVWGLGFEAWGFGGLGVQGVFGALGFGGLGL